MGRQFSIKLRKKLNSLNISYKQIRKKQKKISQAQKEEIFNCFKPLGLKNSKGYCFLNSVIQVLFNCDDFTNEIVNFHCKDLIVNLPYGSDNLIFINDFCKLIYELKTRNISNLLYTIEKVQSHFEASSDGDDVNKCFMYILTSINEALKNDVTDKNDSFISVDADQTFEHYRAINNNFIFDLFYGQVSILTSCKCGIVFNKSYQLIKTIPLFLQNYNETLQSCLNNYFADSYVVNDNDCIYKCCSDKPIIIRNSITHAPKYLCLYLNRGSFYENGPKNERYVANSGFLKLPTIKEVVEYKLLGVIDHFGTSQDGHYIAKAHLKNFWWIFNDEIILPMRKSIYSIVSKNSVMFIFQKY